MEIDADQALAVVDHRQAAFEMHAGLGHADDASGRSQNGRALGGGEVGAVVGTLGLAVQDTLAAEPARAPPALGRQGHGEAVPEVLGVDTAGKSGELQFVLSLQPGQQGGVAGADLVFRQAGDALDVEVAAGDGEDLVQRAAGRADPQGRGGGGVTIEADDEQATGAGAANGLAIQPEIGAGCGAAEGEAALPVRTADLQGRRRGEGRSGDGGGGEAEEGGAPVQEVSSFQRFRASPGPA